MRHLRPVGRGASARKYDLLTALGAYALAADPGEQRRILRLMTLITARYNWTEDYLCVGQREIARLWACTDRTVKREVSVLKGRGWLEIRRQGARGRVSEYRVGLERIIADTRPVWNAVGPDFAARLGAPEPTNSANVVPMPMTGNAPVPDAADVTEWGLARHILRAADAGLYGAWFHALSREGRVGGILMLRAPSRFHASYVQTHLSGHVLTACRDVDASLESVEVTA